MRDAIAQPLRCLLDPNTVMTCVDSRTFSDISRRYQAAQKLAQVLKTEPLDLTPIDLYLLQRKEVARQSLESGNYSQFNSEVKVCKLISEELVEVSVGSTIVADLENDLRERVLNQQLDKLRSAQNIPDAVAASQRLRKVANDAPDTHEWVTAALEGAFQDLENNPAFNIKGLLALGMKLAQTPLGQNIVAEHPAVFGAVKDMQSNELFRRAGENQDLGGVVACLTRESGLGGQEYNELVVALQNHEFQFDQLKSKYLCGDGSSSIEEIKKLAKADLDLAVEACSREDRSAESVLKVIAHLSMCFTLVKSGQKYLDAAVSEQESKLVILHRAQILTLYRFLQCHKQSDDSFWKRLWRKVEKTVCGAQPVRKPENHLAQASLVEKPCLHFQ